MCALCTLPRAADGSPCATPHRIQVTRNLWHFCTVHRRADYNKCVAAIRLEHTSCMRSYIFISPGILLHCAGSYKRGLAAIITTTQKLAVAHTHTCASLVRSSTVALPRNRRTRRRAPCSRAAVYYPFKKTYANDVSSCACCSMYVCVCVCVCMKCADRDVRSLCLALAYNPKYTHTHKQTQAYGILHEDVRQRVSRSLLPLFCVFPVCFCIRAAKRR